MKIDNISSVLNSSLNNTANIRSGKSAVTAQTNNTSTNVQLSEQLQDAQSNADVFDSQKVDQIKAAIAEGRFTVNANAVAESLISTAKDLILTQTRSA